MDVRTLVLALRPLVLQANGLLTLSDMLQDGFVLTQLGTVTPIFGLVAFANCSTGEPFRFKARLFDASARLVAESAPLQGRYESNSHAVGFSITSMFVVFGDYHLDILVDDRVVASRTLPVVAPTTTLATVALEKSN